MNSSSQNLSAADLATEHRAGRREITATVRDALARAHARQDEFNAFVAIDESGARSAAETLTSDASPEGILAGVPVSVKDILDVAGLPTRWGSPLMAAAQPATTDIAAVARLRAAGAVIVGKTTTTEFAHSPLGGSPLTGLTLNPWAPEFTCGGSSAGAGVSVAAGIVPIALATDAGCSTRLPAACTGTIGLKPTLGRVPHDRVPEAFGNFIHLGLITRTVRDCGLALDALSGPHPADPQSLRLKGIEPVGDPASAGLKGRRIVLWMNAGNARVSQEVRAATRRAAEVFTQLGAEVSEETYPLAHPDPVWRTLQQSNWAARFATASEGDRAKLSPTLVAGIDEALAYRGLDLQRAGVKRTELYRGVQKTFGAGAHFILTPCVSAVPVAADFDLAAPLVIDGEEAGDLRSEWTPYLSLFDLTGHPAIALPIGLADNGAPLGVQLVAPWYAEKDLLAASAAFESALPSRVWQGASG